MGTSRNATSDSPAPVGRIYQDREPSQEILPTLPLATPAPNPADPRRRRRSDPGGAPRWERRRELSRRGQSYALLARRYAHAEWFHEWAASLGEHLYVTFGDGRGYRTVRLEVSELKEVAEDERLMRRKYERAAACPWLPIEPDPSVSELERLADEKSSPRSMSPLAFPVVLDPHPIRP